MTQRLSSQEKLLAFSVGFSPKYSGHHTHFFSAHDTKARRLASGRNSLLFLPFKPALFRLLALFLFSEPTLCGLSLFVFVSCVF
jgi:hypothetical protein